MRAACPAAGGHDVAIAGPAGHIIFQPSTLSAVTGGLADLERSSTISIQVANASNGSGQTANLVPLLIFQMGVPVSSKNASRRTSPACHDVVHVRRQGHKEGYVAQGNRSSP